MSRSDTQTQTNGTDTMSHDVYSVLDAISEAKAALDAKPEFERRIRDLEMQLAESQRHAQGLEENIIGYKANITANKERIDKLTVERDDAILHNLELEDRIHSVSRFLSAMQSEAVALDKSLNPQPAPTLEPIVEQPVELPMTGQSETHPTATTTGFVNAIVNQDVPSTSSGHAQETTTSIPPLTYDSGYNPDIGTGPSVANEVETKPQPYTNRLYYFCKDYMPMTKWAAGGGTEYSYYWRPSAGDPAWHTPTGFSSERFSAV